MIYIFIKSTLYMMVKTLLFKKNISWSVIVVFKGGGGVLKNLSYK